MMEEKLHKVIQKIVLPHYPSIVKYSLKKQGQRTMKYNFVFDRPIYKDSIVYNVTYIFDSRESMNKLANKVIDETINLFEMLNPEESEFIEVIRVYPEFVKK